jgi:hypothetical protein
MSNNVARTAEQTESVAETTGRVEPAGSIVLLEVKYNPETRGMDISYPEGLKNFALQKIIASLQKLSDEAVLPTLATGQVEPSQVSKNGSSKKSKVVRQVEGVQ